MPAHRLLHYLLEAVAKVGEAQRMVQYKEKSRAGAEDGTRLALLTYPVLMAADILLYDVAAVPVGDDQDQHLQLARPSRTGPTGSTERAWWSPRASVPRRARG